MSCPKCEPKSRGVGIPDYLVRGKQTPQTT